MKTISLKTILQEQIRQIRKELDWAVDLNNYPKAQELAFEIIELSKKIKTLN